MASDAPVSEPVVAGIELGGTKLCLVVGRGREIIERRRLPTGMPGESLPIAAAQLDDWRARYDAQALGIASFGPVAVDANAPEFGRILSTPKQGWVGTDIVGALAGGFGGRLAVHTDVTAAAMAEGRWGAARGLRDFVYVTIGTGIGMGVIAGGRPLTGAMHPEAGHVRVRRLPEDGFAGTCPFHGDCLEGLASGPAIAARCGADAKTLKPDDPGWAFVADALAEAFASLFLTLSTACIIVGGGVGIGQPQLLPEVRRRVVAKLAGYLPFIDDQAIATRIVLAELGSDAGPLGALALARTALHPAD